MKTLFIFVLFLSHSSITANSFKLSRIQSPAYFISKQYHKYNSKIFANGKIDDYSPISISSTEDRVDTLNDRLFISQQLPVNASIYLKDTIGCISHHEAKELQLLFKKYIKSQESIQKEFEFSIDLNMTFKKLNLNNEGIYINKTNLIATWDEINSIAKKTTCFALYSDGSKPWQINTLSANTGIPASLSPPLDKSGAPTLILGGFTMHRIAGDNINPTIDTDAKIASIKINKGYRILDTCMGLGYTAIHAAKKVGNTGEVFTIEYDEASLEISSYNPWSQGLFNNSLPIHIYQGDSCEIIKSFPSNYFNAIIHDPPARALTRTDLYGLEFYKDLHRVLKRSGQVFHYIGSPDSKESGRLYSGIISRLIEAGFVNVKKSVRAFGVVCTARDDVL